MRLAEVTDGIVVNVIEVDPQAIPGWAQDWPEITEGGPGWGYDGETFTPPEPEPEPTPAELRAAMPEITPRQLRLTLIRAGISLASVEAAIDAIPDAAAREEARVEWDYASRYERLHPLLAQVAGALGLSDEAVDALWAQAVTL